jgi:hypothetical protein
LALRDRPRRGAGGRGDLGSAAAAPHQALVGRPLPAAEGPTLAQTAASLRARLDAAAFDVAWAAGQATPLEQAVADALEENTDTA